MDVSMPVMDGFEALRRIRDAGSLVRNHKIPVIALTAYAMRDDEEKCMRAGMDAYARKPIDWPALSRIISTFAPGNSRSSADVAIEMANHKLPACDVMPKNNSDNL